MPYTGAVIQETLRKSSIVPMGLMHEATEDTTLHGFNIPKGTIIITNQYSVHHNKETWGDPENFRPERFLSSDAISLVKGDRIIPFSVGRRVCLGEPLARDQLFLFIVNIFQKFKLIPDPSNPQPSLEPRVGFLTAPKPFTVVATTRTHS
jgi:cytochrome P450